jgi:hypothetical protein
MIDIVAIDFETYYSREFSLSKMTTEEYIRHPDFEVIGVGIKRVGDEGSGAWYTGDDVGPALHQLNLHKCAVLAHHAAFDGAILSWKYGIQPAFWLDTLSMSRPIHGTNVGGSLKALADHYQIGAKGTEVVDAMGKRLADFTPQELHQYGRYCINDVELTIKLLAILRPFIPPGELRVIDLLIRCYTEPVIELDVPLLEQHLQNTRDGKSSLLKALTKDGDESKLKDILMSNDKFAALLQALRVVPPTKISQRTGKEAWAFSKTDAEFTALLEHPNPKVQAAVAARLGTKSTIEETRTQNLLGVASRGRLPIMLNYWGAHTGRLSGGDGMNLQNLPSRGNTTIRRALRAPEGYAVIACDSSQIEARIVAWLAGQDDLVQAFREGRDIYSEFATDVYGRLITKSDKTERFVGKTCIAEGTLILTERGEVPIEDITIEDRVWDGVEWVNHEGVVYQGEKEVICYDGLYATADHGVLTDQGALPLGIAASRLATLLTSGDAGEAVRVSEDYLPADTTPEETHLLVRRMYEMWRTGLDQCGQLEVRQIQRLSDLFANQVKTFDYTWAKIRRHSSSLYQSITQALRDLWWTWYQTTIRVAHGLYPLGGEISSAPGLQWRGGRPGGQRRTLHPRKPPAGYAPGAGQQQAQYSQGLLAGAGDTTCGVPFPVHPLLDVQISGEGRANRRAGDGKVRVYDILNAGPRRRYTAANKLVLNCILGLGYGMGAAKLQRTLELGMAGISVKLELDEAERIVRLYRQKYHKIPMLWRQCDNALAGIASANPGAIGGAVPYDARGVRLPNGIYLTYAELRSSPNGYEYIGERRELAKFKRGEPAEFDKIYGGKLTENVVQGLAAQVIREQMVAAVNAKMKIVLQVHDEIVVAVPEESGEAMEAKLVEIMSTPPKWAAGLPVACEAGRADNYGDT